jgi:outer membrane protein
MAAPFAADEAASTFPDVSTIVKQLPSRTTEATGRQRRTLHSATNMKDSVFGRRFGCACCAAMLLCNTRTLAFGQNLSQSPSEPWRNEKKQAQFDRALKAFPESSYSVDSSHPHTLAELIDLAEVHNPDTRISWQNAKAKLADLGIAESALYPTVAAVATAATWRNGPLIGASFHRQTIGLFQPTLNLNYLVFDFGRRSGAITEAKDDLYAADFAFNATHLRIIYNVAVTYYRLLNAIGQVDAAKANLLNAQTVLKDSEARLRNGVATLPDVLESQAAQAQAEYDLQAAVGSQDVAHGDLATALGLPAYTQFEVQKIADLTIPDQLNETAEEAVDRALDQRPDLLEQVAKIRAAEAALKQARSDYLPSLTLSGLGGLQRAYGQQDLLPGTYAGGETWNVQLNLQWTLFDGARRENTIAEAKAKRTQAKAELDAARDQISNEVWTAYSNLKTAQRQRQAAAALLASADRSYAAALRSYNLGLRSLLDVVAAQKALAQARSSDVSARTQVMTQISNLAFRTADLLRTPAPIIGPQP